jgi:hypothetical protein
MSESTLPASSASPANLAQESLEQVPGSSELATAITQYATTLEHLETAMEASEKDTSERDLPSLIYQVLLARDTVEGQLPQRLATTHTL